MTVSSEHEDYADFILTKDLNYVEISESVFFPLLTSSVLTGCIKLSKAGGQTDALKAFRQHVRTRKS